MELYERDHDDLSIGLTPGGPFVDREECDLCRWDLCHFCGGVDQEPAIWGTPVGAFEVGMCDECFALGLPPMSAPDAVRLCLTHPADEEGDAR